jgi:hypothetical protein
MADASIPPEQDAAALRILYDYARQRGNGDVDSGLVQSCADVLATEHADDLFAGRNRIVYPRVVAALIECEQITTDEAKRRAGDIALNAVLRAQDLLDTQTDHAVLKPVAPRPLFRDVGEPEPFPIESLGELLSLAARAIHDLIQAPTAVGAQSVLATATLAAQGRANVRLPYGPSRPLSDYFVLILESGERKTAADDIAARPLHQYEQELAAGYRADLGDHNAAAAAFDAEWKRITNDRKLSQQERKEKLAALGTKPEAPRYPMVVCAEPTYEGLFRLLQQGQPSAGVFSSEGGQLIGGYAMSDEHRLRTAAGLSEGWDGKPWKRVRGGDGLTVLPNRRVTLNLMVQPLVATRLLSDSVLRDQGVLSRVLVAAPLGTSGTRLWHEPDAASGTALDKYTLRVLEILRSGQAGRDGELPPLGFSGRARELWIAFADSIERQLGPASSALREQGGGARRKDRWGSDRHRQYRGVRHQ